MKRVIIIDDESDARLLIRQYLQAFRDFEIVAEATNGREAVARINELEPDLAFVDIQMPGISGIQIIQHLVHLPQIIFTTAFDHYALRAFELNAIDYLLKPYTEERFNRAISRIQTQHLSNINHWKNMDETPSMILVENGNKLINLDVKDIIYLNADKDYTWIHTETGSYLSNFGISLLEQRMDKRLFLRIHRSFIVNLNYIKEVYRDGWSVQVILKNEKALNVSRSYLEDLRKYFY